MYPTSLGAPIATPNTFQVYRSVANALEHLRLSSDGNTLKRPLRHPRGAPKREIHASRHTDFCLKLEIFVLSTLMTSKCSATFLLNYKVCKVTVRSDDSEE